MKKWFVIFLLLPLATAQTELLSDPPGDVSKTLAGQAVSVPLYDFIDLRALHVEETAQTIDFQLDLESTATTAWFLEGGQFMVSMKHLDQTYRAFISAQAPAPQSEDLALFGNFQSFNEAANRWDTLRFVPVELDGASIVFSLERDWLLDASGAPPFPGRVLSEIQVASAAGIQLGDPISSANYDLMPDNKDDSASFPITMGLQQTGSLRLSSALPFRASNGEATTFIFHVRLLDQQSEEGLIQLSATGVPEGWSVQLPGEEMLLEENVTLALPLLVSVPFRHVHGEVESFILEATGTNGVGRVELGVRYLEIPQPAGHHNQLFLHALNLPSNPINDALDTVAATTNSRTLVMNTEESYELAVQESVAGNGGIGPNNAWNWRIPLSPSLEMGLDFDVTRLGTMEIPFESPLSLTDAQPSATLRLLECGSDFRCEQTVLGTFDADPITVGPSPVGASFQFTPTPEADFIPFAPAGSDLFLDVALQPTTIATGPIQPAKIAPGGWLELPLDEYHDAVEEGLTSLSGVDFVADGAVERRINPGESALLNFTLTNTGIVRETFTLEVTGTHDWGAVLGAQEISVSPGDERRVVASISVPEDQEDGLVVDFVVKATSTKDPNVQALVPFRGIVDTVFDYPDEASLILQTEEELSNQKAPIPAAGAMVLVVLGCRKLFQA